MTYEIGIDKAIGRDFSIEDRYMRPSAEYPDGSWLHLFDGEVQIATGYYATLYPDKPSPYFHGRPPFVMLETGDWPFKFDGGRPFDAAVDRVIKMVDRHLLGDGNDSVAKDSSR